MGGELGGDVAAGKGRLAVWACLWHSCVQEWVLWEWAVHNLSSAPICVCACRCVRGPSAREGWGRCRRSGER